MLHILLVVLFAAPFAIGALIRNEDLEANTDIDGLEIDYYKGHYYANCSIDGSSVFRRMLVDVTSPMFMITQLNSLNEEDAYNQKSISKVKEITLYADAGSVLLTLSEPWIRGITVYNTRHGDVYSLGKIENVQYTVKTARIAIDTPSTFDWTHNANGVFGLGYIGKSGFTYSIADKLKITGYGISITTNNSYISFNYYDAFYEDKLIWGQRMTNVPHSSNSFYFPVFDLTICDVSVYGDYSSFIPATISTVSRCLTLPQQIFKNMLGWLPLVCGKDGGVSSLCYLPDNWSEDDYPTIEFKMNPNTGVIRISLKDLIIEEYSRKYVCIVNGSSLDSPFTIPLNNNGIVFGSMVLSSLYTAVNTTEGRIGIVPRTEYAHSSGNCYAQQRCFHGQRYHRPSNTCKEPNCDSYYFMTLDTDKHECRTHPIAIILFWGIVAYYCELNQFIQTNKCRQQLIHNYA